jgi:anti-sigma B factor antagonist
MNQAEPKISIEYKGKVTIAILTEEKILQEVDIQGLENSIMALIEQVSGINLIINFCNVKFLTSSALGLLIRVLRKMHGTGGKLKLCSIDPRIFEVFMITRLDEVFEIYDSQEEAVESFE